MASNLPLRCFKRFNKLTGVINSRFMSDGELGSGAGKGGGSGGSIRDAGGSFGKMEAAREDQYFRKQQNEQLAKLKSHMEEEISHHKNQIKQHEKEIERHKKRIEKLHKEED